MRPYGYPDLPSSLCPVASGPVRPKRKLESLGPNVPSRGTAIWYAVAGITYVGAATIEKGLLNWLIGPAWLVAVVTFGPLVLDRSRRRR